MAVNTKEIKQRIKSVKNTKKMTKAMELVSAAKMRKAVQGALATRMFATLARELLEQLASGNKPTSPLLEERPVARLLVILITSNRGLCGSFNANIFKRAWQILQDKTNVARHRGLDGKDIIPLSDVAVDVIGVGKKSATFAKRHNYPLIAAFDHLSERPAFEDILSISSMARKAFTEKTYDKVVVMYTQYNSSLSQTVKARQLLPVSPHDLEKMLVVGEKAEEIPSLKQNGYLFEPNPETIIATIVPRLVDIQLYQAILESSASEHSTRMVAMKNASSSAGDMINGLTLEFNKARQAAITQEIAEIAGGAAALE
ncbi:MAG: ATP synthase F1 subunit gamma [Candidatus Magasanikbacteria bacterium RIFCSPHIGHO2_01_FULL_41_23]|uniref:ATP synthase gamma chain n=1 Tax=Candidatus Magasanikbacteria bacterium RIFCSPLOWO2_01_FULL_40_15 TaxID=1798686 RepID=A0A1F6N3K1_9BACT|nr:MAG: ATP synthase F1 subunit gamma [Candidatus Magasanikbacteria bacterium RIFCSPHIGHO2_01_FULL_41_23]OGH66960.1 MAG: ATP synthase F1 subunit gamma [Candidatus Magasanikbacteria bacterium RIFCSPHIGHO2_02_FULL_41_35]OGH74941.1 MAG: ATP synthase F1 subunit gamma [Candidatus Magasanikbacteria bacterium RIFCSPHIGHO2_12_FULL_41_16]OGH78243.1 MAG: ATP synthase F1 subunit gamma [Candidatus Magasanikbacteria bacterium RIFCSPLOWO2_01_FULL_40_15]